MGIRKPGRELAAGQQRPDSVVHLAGAGRGTAQSWNGPRPAGDADAEADPHRDKPAVEPTLEDLRPSKCARGFEAKSFEAKSESFVLSIRIRAGVNQDDAAGNRDDVALDVELRGSGPLPDAAPLDLLIIRWKPALVGSGRRRDRPRPRCWWGLVAQTGGRLVTVTRLARELHPGAWWIWALGLAVFASLLTNPFLLLLIIGVAAYVVSVRRSNHPWGASFTLYLGLAVVIVIFRVGFRVLLGSYVGPNDTILFTLPQIPLPHWVLGLKLLGPVTAASVLGGLYDGLRLAAIVVCVGAANALANPKRLLKSLPPAFYEIGTTLVISISVMPQLAASVSRVRRARELRGVAGGRVARLRGIIVPVLEDALERSMSLAAGMDARGYGRTGRASASQRRWTGAFLLGALVGVGVGSYGLLDQTSPRWMSTPAIVLGVLLAVAGFWSSGRRVQRSRYRPDTWRPAEIGVALTGILVAAGALMFVTDPLVRDPSVYKVPPVPLVALVIALIGLAPAWLAPIPQERIGASNRTEIEAAGGEDHVRAA